jgi:hypothetical protein
MRVAARKSPPFFCSTASSACFPWSYFPSFCAIFPEPAPHRAHPASDSLARRHPRIGNVRGNGFGDVLSSISSVILEPVRPLARPAKHRHTHAASNGSVRQIPRHFAWLVGTLVSGKSGSDRRHRSRLVHREPHATLVEALPRSPGRPCRQQPSPNSGRHWRRRNGIQRTFLPHRV